LKSLFESSSEGVGRLPPERLQKPKGGVKMALTTLEKKRIMELLDAPTVPIPVRKNHGRGPELDTDVLYPIGGEDALRELWEYRKPTYTKIDYIELLFLRRGEGFLKVRPGWHSYVKDSVSICKLNPETRKEIGTYENLRNWVEKEIERHVLLLTKEEFRVYPFAKYFQWMDGITEARLYRLQHHDFQETNLTDFVTGRTTHHYVFTEDEDLVKLEGTPSTCNYINGRIVKTTGDTVEEMLAAQGIEKEAVEYIVFVADVAYTPTSDFTEGCITIPAADISISKKG